jgi:hypothetical protein
MQRGRPWHASSLPPTRLPYLPDSERFFNGLKVFTTRCFQNTGALSAKIQFQWVGSGKMEELEEDHGEGASGLQVRLYESELGFV